uniref:Unkown protein n=1 Tax=Riptortus pedestris TaxID=329032 RepID=R4WE12_RIPPE|nr:unkown protein [Riptortus pedestris]
MNTRVRTNRIKNVLYVPPHARKSNCINNSEELRCNDSKRVKLCDDSNLLFKAARKTEERYLKDYLNHVQEKKNQSSLKKDTSCTFLNESSDEKSRPKTCSVSAKRLVSNALGVKLTLTSAEQEEISRIANERELKLIKKTKSQNSGLC